jgi:hypothetical protein
MKTDCMAWKIWVYVVLALAMGDGQALAQAISSRGTPVNAGRSALGAGGMIRLRELTGLGPRSVMQGSNSSGNRRGESRNWVELGLQFDTEPEWQDEIIFHFFALLKNRETAKFTLLKGTVTYVDVARGRSRMGSAYIRPAGLARFGDVIGVAVEAVIKGEVVGTLSEGKLGPGKPLPQDWWKRPELVPVQGYVVDRSKTPFALVNFDDYEALK